MIRLMYMLPMLLGRTYDVKKNLVGVDIFPLESVQSPQVIPESFYGSTYKRVENSYDVKEVLAINGDLSLGIKAGLFKFRGAGTYVKEKLNAQNSVDILTRVTFRTVSKSLPLSAKPVASWFNIGKEYLGTHFVRSILYGGELIACVRFKAVKSEYLQDIRATIKTSLEKGSALDLVGDGKLESLDKKLAKNATMEINYYATVPLEGVPNTIEGLRDLVRDFEKHVQKENDGLGVPIEVVLEELSSLNPPQGLTYLKHIDLETELKFFEDYLDDLLTAKSKFKAWISDLPDVLSNEEEKEISEFSERLSSVLTKFIDTIATLNLEKDSSQLDDARSAYKKGKGSGMVGKFNKELKKLKRKIALSRKAQDRGSTVYTHYGATECVKEEHTSTIYSGYLASSPRGTKTGYNYLCLPELTRRNTQEELVGDTSKIAGVKYGLMITRPFQTIDDKILRSVACSVCLVKQRPAVHTFLGQSECPEESGWILQYSGFIIASTDASRSEHICVDPSLGSHSDISSDRYGDQSLSFVLAKQDKENVFIHCAVCSK